MKLLQFYPYFIAVVFSGFIYYLIAIDLTDEIGQFIILFSTLIPTIIIARFYHMKFNKAFMISFSFYLVGIAFMYYVFEHVGPYRMSLHRLAFPFYFAVCTIGIVIGFIISKRET
ncbi:hypothetical protein GCM10008967_28630 [Bacillus carboniphilus]|uniref:Permease n=1 Tax=Bacillus carboniphilus TaxID=86663 RepID=A0ABN0WH94_9BACI